MRQLNSMIFLGFSGFGYTTCRWTIASSTRQHYSIISSVQIHLCIVNTFAQTDAAHLGNRRKHTDNCINYSLLLLVEISRMQRQIISNIEQNHTLNIQQTQ